MHSENTTDENKRPDEPPLTVDAADRHLNSIDSSNHAGELRRILDAWERLCESGTEPTFEEIVELLTVDVDRFPCLRLEFELATQGLRWFDQKFERAEFLKASTKTTLKTYLTPSVNPEAIGEIDSFRVLDVIESGGMGIVLLADDLRLRRTVALKVLRPDVAAQPGAKQRFLREARSMAALQHDHIVPVYHVGEQAGLPYLAMPRLLGESLQSKLDRERKLSLDQVLQIGRETALGLAAAHAAGLIHRDIKPSNLWCEQITAPTAKPVTNGLPLENFRVKLLDFGLVRVQADDLNLTQTGAIAGTPYFMSPEQARGEPVDERSDLFSLGIVLYRALTGILPFSGKSQSSVLLSILNDSVPPLHDQFEGPFDDRVTRLDELLTRLMEKCPSDRIQSAIELVGLLENIHAMGSPMNAPSIHVADVDNASEQVHNTFVFTPLRRLKWLVAGSLLGLVLLGGVVTQYRGSKWLLTEIEHPKVAEAELEHAGTPPPPVVRSVNTYRSAALAVLQAGGSVDLQTSAIRTAKITNLTDLPLADFIINSIDLSGHSDVGNGIVPELLDLDYLPVLDVSGTAISPQGLQELVTSNIIPRLITNASTVDDAVLRTLGERGDLVSLTLNGEPHPARTPQGLAFLSQLPRLRFLQMNLLNPEEELREIGQISCLNTFFSYSSIHQPEVIQPFKEQANLRVLACRPEHLDEGWLDALGQLKQLTFLDLRSVKTTPEALEVVRRNLPNCVVYHDRHALLEDQAEALRWILSEQGTASGNVENRWGIRFTDIPNAPFVLTQASLPESLAASDFSLLTNLGSIENFSCKYPVSDSHAQILGSLQGLNGLFLARCDPLTAEGLQAMTSLDALGSIQLGFCTRITGDDWMQLSHLPRLNSLHLDRCKVDSIALAHIGRLPQLTKLQLTRCQDVSVEGLRHLISLSGLRELSLRTMSQIDDSAVPFLKQLTTLRRLDIEGTQISPEGAGKIHKALPHCAIWSSDGYLLHGNTAKTEKY